MLQTEQVSHRGKQMAQKEKITPGIKTWHQRKRSLKSNFVKIYSMNNSAMSHLFQTYTPYTEYITPPVISEWGHCHHYTGTAL